MLDRVVVKCMVDDRKAGLLQLVCVKGRESDIEMRILMRWLGIDSSWVSGTRLVV